MDINRLKKAVEEIKTSVNTIIENEYDNNVKESMKEIDNFTFELNAFLYTLHTGKLVMFDGATLHKNKENIKKLINREDLPVEIKLLCKNLISILDYLKFDELKEIAEDIRTNIGQKLHEKFK